ncbi:pilus assembly protein TadG [Sinorhizobium sp. A49]|uniref:TadE/TadG family type IV pilus assembly protein n=1 Tax=Sinorhizobium sp. A49 TaxID=1945861 RepID=UPI00098507DA|nr:TadE/TadG family type IV pilus assembly protein [Sinorhizobium sp. A49]OOG74492.1 pilus assembly protein TadG [Sinorhizobium sp. A49]
MLAEQEVQGSRQSSRSNRGPLRRLFANKNGAASIEFAILVIPFLVVTFACFETFFAFTGERLLANATEVMARKVRTGEITFARGKPTDMTEKQFRQAFCAEIAVMLKCSATEVNIPSRLLIDVKSTTDLAQLPVDIPRMAKSNDINTGNFSFAPGGPGTYNVLRAYYRWSVITDLVRPFVTNLRPAGTSMPRDYLMVATATFRNENE